jgi:H+-translocating NAD(P) transhydrogenase subunit beta
MNTLIPLAYLAASVLFVIGLKMLSRQATSRRGNLLSAVGMLLAIVATLVSRDIIAYHWILAGLAIGTVVGAVAALRVPMTSMPEFVALFNGFGGMASLLVGWSEYHRAWLAVRALPASASPAIEPAFSIPVVLAVLIGGITFSGSMIAYAKLAERIPGRPFLFKFQQIVNALLLVAAVTLAVLFVVWPASLYPVLLLLVLLALALGVFATIPIGGADMPVVISLLNSYSGLAACAAGFALQNSVLIVSGSLVGASGIILTTIMCKAMNRSLRNVLFSGFGSAGSSKSALVQGEAKAVSAEDAYFVLEAAHKVLIVPGYGMAVAQAQHAVRELGELLEKNGAEVLYAIHPVAGRMPGHMNVLLAEANVPYEQLAEMDEVNPTIETVDVCLVIGANDVVNPAAREDPDSPLAGMPIINVDLARTVFILKRSMASGFAGVDNPLFFKENARMLFGDAKATVSALVAEFKEAG